MPATDREVRAWIKGALKERYGAKLSRLILAGSRAKGTNRSDSDWDILAVIEDVRSIWPIGPIRKQSKLNAPDGNLVEVFEMNPDDLNHEDAARSPLVREALIYGIDV